MKKKLIITLAVLFLGMAWKAMPAEAAKIPVIKNGSAVSQNRIYHLCTVQDVVLREWYPRFL